jgi:hypothetical protein
MTMNIANRSLFFHSILCVLFFMLTGMSHGFQKGVSFPNQSFPTIEGGQPVSIKDYSGEKVVLHVFASW